MEIERKWLIDKLPKEIEKCPHEKIEQFYVSTAEPIIRLRRYGDKYFLTIKEGGRLKRAEYEFEVNRDYYEKMSLKSDGIIIKKTRYRQPVFFLKKEYIAEIDVFNDYYDGLIYAEVEFESEEEAVSFAAPEWFGKEVTLEKGYSNAELSKGQLPAAEIWRCKACNT